MIKETLYEVKRGESINSLDTWTKLFGKNWNKSRTRRFLKLLENDTMIELIPTRKTTHIKVCNYGSYQDERNVTEPKVKLKRNSSETQVTLNNNGNNENNEEQFNKFYSSYPKKVGKAKAEKAFLKIKPDEELFATMMAALERHKKKWDDPQFIPHPATWLNNSRWEDVLEVETHSVFDDLED